MLIHLLLMLSISLVHCQSYCRCDQAFIYDYSEECLKSANYDVENACYVCPVVNASGTFNYCGSLPYLGLGSCSQAGALDAWKNKCLNFGGNPGFTNAVCVTNTGTNKSQTTGCVSTTTTNAPTNTSPTLGSMLVTFVVTLMISFI